MMQAWEQRPVEIANLLNPAFCGILLAKTIESFTNEDGQGMEFGLVFLVLPIVLHQDTRNSLPRGISTTLLAWIESHQAQLIGFPDRVQRLDAVTRESVMFDLVHGTIRFDQEGRLVPGSVQVITTQKALAQFTSEVQDCVRKSIFIGRWLAKAGTASTILVGWGVSP